MRKRIKHNKIDIAIKAVKFASYNLNIITPEVIFLEKTNFPNGNITSMFLITDYVIIFNKSWLELALPEEVIITSFHESRHAYQASQIEAYNKKLSLTEDKHVILVWKEEFNCYFKPSGEKEFDNNYMNQLIEIDAIEYAETLFAKISKVDKVN